MHGLAPVDFDGQPYTWTNGSIWQRLDRVLTNSAWADLFDTTKVSHLVRGRSDHAPLLVKCGVTAPRKASFRFLNVWQHHSGFDQVVRDAWEIPVRGVGMVRFVRKLSLLRKKLREWNRSTFGNIFSRVKEAEAVLQLREREFDLARDEDSKIRLNEARALHAREMSVECEFWRQKAAIKWLKAGDANYYKYFHSIVKQRRSLNFISRVRADSGQWLEDVDSIKSSATQFFSRLFASDREGRRLPTLPFHLPMASESDNDSLELLPSLDELKSVAFSLSSESAPGPDGFGAGVGDLRSKYFFSLDLSSLEGWVLFVREPRIKRLKENLSDFRVKKLV